jgi:hypothetical protein
MNRYLVGGALALALSVVPLAGVASAQPAGGYTTHAAEQMERGADTAKKDMNWGWLGLIGLAGLAGLRKHRGEDEPARRRTSDFRSNEPLGSR